MPWKRQSSKLFSKQSKEEKRVNRCFDKRIITSSYHYCSTRSLHVSGKELTPFLLSKLKSLTGGDSLKSNIELVKNNALVGAKIAAAFYEMNNNSTGSQHPSPSTSPSSTASIPTSTSFKSFSSSVSSTRTASKRPMIIGGTVLDITAKINTTPNTEFLSTSNPGTVIQSLGGVGRNVAEACHRTGGNPLILSALGSDKPNITSSSSSSNHHILSSIVGIEAEFTSIGMDTSLLIKSNDFPTAIYNVVLAPNGDMHVAVADMRVHSEILPEHIEARIRQVK